MLGEGRDSHGCCLWQHARVSAERAPGERVPRPPWWQARTASARGTLLLAAWLLLLGVAALVTGVLRDLSWLLVIGPFSLFQAVLLLLGGRAQQREARQARRIPRPGRSES